MPSRMLLTLSIIADILDIFVVGQIPGLSHIIDVPIILLHFLAGGPRAFLTILEALPLAGFLPIFSWFAWRYHRTGRY